jgi:hypothetical protein
MDNTQSTWSPGSEHDASREKGSSGFGEIVVFIDGCLGTEGILEFASALAEPCGARLISIFMQPQPTVTPAETFARGKGMQSVVEVHRVEVEAVEAKHRALFEGMVRRLGIQSEWRSLPYMSSEVGVRAYYADLVVGWAPESGRSYGRPSWICGVSCPELWPSDHHFSSRQHGIPNPPDPRGVEWPPRSHPGRGGRSAIACEGRGRRGLGCRRSTPCCRSRAGAWG